MTCVASTMCASPRNVIIPTPPHPTPRETSRVRSIKHVCKCKVRHHPHPTPPHPERNILFAYHRPCVQVRGTSSSPPPQVMGWGGVGMMTFLGLAHMVDATQVMGWGGVGMMTFLGLAHMVDDTQTGCFSRGGVGWGGDDDVPCTCTHVWCYAHGMFLSGWGGVGWGWWRSSDLHTWSMLRKSWGGVGWGWWRSSDLHTWSMIRKQDVSVGVGWGGVGMMTAGSGCRNGFLPP